MMALGGSTNGILHLLALAREAEVRKTRDLGLKERLEPITPHVEIEENKYGYKQNAKDRNTER